MIPSRPLSLVEILAETFSLYARTFLRYALFLIILAVPGTVLLTVGSSGLGSDIITSAQHDIGFNDSDLTTLRNDTRAWFAVQNPIFAVEWPAADTTQYPHASTKRFANYVETNLSKFQSSANLFALGILLLMIGIFALAAVTVDLGCQVFENRPQEIGGSLRASFASHVWKMLFLYILYLAITWTLDGILLALPSEIGGVLASFVMVAQIYILIRFAVIVPVLVSEELGPFQAVRRSWELTRRSGWHVFAAAFTFGIIFFLAMIVVSMVLSLFSGSYFTWFNDLFARKYLTIAWLLQEYPNFVQSMAIVMMLGMLMLFSMVPVFATVLYYDLRTRHDGPLVYLED